MRCRAGSSSRFMEELLGPLVELFGFAFELFGEMLLDWVPPRWQWRIVLFAIVTAVLFLLYRSARLHGMI